MNVNNGPHLSPLGPLTLQSHRYVPTFAYWVVRHLPGTDGVTLGSLLVKLVHITHFDNKSKTNKHTDTRLTASFPEQPV